jgi:multiple sugar transport system permease protein
MPLALPGLIAAGVFAFVESWQEFVFARALIRDNDMWVGSVGIASFFGFRTTQWNDVMVAAIVFSLPPLLLFLAFQRYFVAGLSGGVKG